jgi:hypothetical protein
MRVELALDEPESLLVRIAKEKYGRVTPARHIAWARPASEVGFAVNG